MNIAIMGYGVVGSGVAEVITMNQAKVSQKSEREEIKIKYILDIRKFPGDPFENLVIDDFNKILQDESIEIVVETMGGLKPAYEFVSACFKAGKSVVTSNKELVAEKGYELLQLATENGVHFMFEASVGGGIPAIRTINRCLGGNELSLVAGILNGTTNFILTKMIDEDMTFDDALKLAQDKGYAERDPSADILGHDTCRKICILAALCFGRHIYPKDVPTKGITEIALEDVELAQEYGAVIKLMGFAKALDDKVSIGVAPTLIMKTSVLSNVNGVFNAILARGNAVDDVIFYGKGAGKLPTASAVVGDIIDCASRKGTKAIFHWEKAKEGYVSDPLEEETKLFVRYEGKERDFSEIFGADTVLLSKNSLKGFVTPLGKQKELYKKLENIQGIEIKNVIPVADY